MREVAGLVMCGGSPRLIATDDFPWGHPPGFLEQVFDLIYAHWGEPLFMELEAPSLANDAAFATWLGRYLRMSASPGNAVGMLRFNATVDIRALLPTIHVPTLILHAVGDHIAPIGGARLMASAIPRAQLVELPSSDHIPFGADMDRRWLDLGDGAHRRHRRPERWPVVPTLRPRVQSRCHQLGRAHVLRFWTLRLRFLPTQRGASDRRRRGRLYQRDRLRLLRRACRSVSPSRWGPLVQSPRGSGCSSHP
jgi:hypothetical protein